MKHKTLFEIPLMAALVLMAAETSTYAALTADQIVKHFNGMNGGTGFNFGYASATGKFTSASGYTNVDVSAYSSDRSGMSGNQSYFNSFCANWSINTIAYSGTASLNYNAANGTSQNKSEVYLSVGGAYLYKQFATGAITDDVAWWVRSLNSATTPDSNWTNPYYASLLDINPDKNFWIGNYDARQNYSFMDDYYVFIMNIEDANKLTTQDFFYLANKSTYDIGFGPGDSGSTTPEPATLLLWSLGGLGLACTSQAHKRRMKMLALA